MKTFKRVFSVILTICMLLSLFPAQLMPSAFAEERALHTLGKGDNFGGNEAKVYNPYSDRTGIVGGINNHFLNGYDAFCIDPTMPAANDAWYYYVGNGIGSNANCYHWQNVTNEVSRRQIAAVIVYYYNNLNASYTSGGRTPNETAKLGTQLALYRSVVSANGPGGTDGSSLLADRAGSRLADVVEYSQNALNYSWEKMYKPTITIGLPSFDCETVILSYNPDTGYYEGSVEDTSGYLVSEGYDFTQTANGVSVIQTGSSVTISATPEAVAAAGLAETNNSWSANATVSKSVRDEIDLGALKFYTYGENDQPLVTYDPDLTTGYRTETKTSTLFAIADVQATGFAQVTKSSADSSLTENNSCYSLEGAVYGVYESEDDASTDSNALGYMVTDANGISNTVSLLEGTYYVKETIAPKGYALDTQVYTVSVLSGETAMVSVADIPTSDPVPILLQKIDSATGEPRPAGNLSLADAQYTIEFYGGQYATAEEAETSGSPIRSWVVKTDSDGFADLMNPDLFVSGDEFWTNEMGRITFPLGTVVIYESLAPAGYFIDTTHYVVNITEDGSSLPYVQTYNAPQVPEEPFMGGVTISKTDSENDGAQGNATWAGAKFGIINLNNQSVTVNGVIAQPGEVALVITTDSYGFASSGKVLPYGSYRVVEVEAPAGYALNENWYYDFSITEDGQVFSAGACSDSVLRGGISVQKTDSSLGTSAPYGDASLAGIVFDIYNASYSSVLVNGVLFAPGEKVADMTTDVAGFAQTEANLLPYGTYRVVESYVPAGSGYSLNTEYESIVEVNGTGFFAADTCVNTSSVLGSIAVQKVDAATNAAAAQGDASLAGAMFSVTNSSSNAVVVNGQSYGVGETVATIVTNESGYGSTGNILPMGTYTIKETVAPAGYALNTAWSKTAVVREDNKNWVFDSDSACKEALTYGSISVQKVDVDAAGATSAPKSLAGAEIAIINNSQNPVTVNGVSYRNGETVATITTNSAGVAKSETNLPYGTYSLKEVKAPEGFNINTSWNPTVSIREAKEYVLDGQNALKETWVRGDVKFVKVDGETGGALASVAFRVTNQETGESHIIVTNANGVFDSSALQNSNHTNRNDEAVNQDGSVNESILNSNYGVWFYSNNFSFLDSSRGAFPYGHYTFEELKTSANADYTMTSFEVVVSQNEQIVDVGTVENTAVPKGSVTVRKTDEAMATNGAGSSDSVSHTTPQGNARFAGAKFSVINMGDTSIRVNGMEILPNQTALVMEADDSGVARSGSVLPYGSYRIKETAAPTGYELNSDWYYDFEISANNMAVDAGACADAVLRGGLSVQKLDSESGSNVPSGDASFEGIVFDIYNASANAVYVGNKLVAPGEIVTSITADSKGYATTAANLLPFGDYRIVESFVPANSGYGLNTTYTSTVSITEPGVIYAADTCVNTSSVLGSIAVQKVDAVTNAAAAQGDTSLAGAKFSVVNSSSSAVVVNGQSYAVGEVVATITTNDSGYGTTGNVLPMGTYTIKETEAPAGYTLNTNWSKTATVRENNKNWTFNSNDACKETVIYGSISVQKVDTDAAGATSAPKSLAGAEIAIINNSQNPVTVNGVSYRNGETVATITTNSAGVAKSETNLPYGTYSLKEVKAPEGFNINTSWNPTVSIREAKEYALDGQNALKETWIRGDVKFVKVDGETGGTLASVAFRVTNQETGESHIIVTNANGVFDSSALQNSNHTNRNDEAVNQDGSVNESILNSNYGVWFYSNNFSFLDNSRGAFPYGHYTFEELKTSANADYTMTSFEVVVSQNEQIVDVGTVENTPVPKGSVTAHKADADRTPGLNGPEGNGSLAGAQFSIYNAGTEAVRVNGIEIDPNSLALIIETDSTGTASSGDILPYGTYRMKETAAPVGYDLNAEWFADFEINANNTNVDIGPCEDRIIRGGLSVQKTDAATGDSTPYGNASFEDVVFHVYNASAHPVVVNGVQVAPGALAAEMTTDSSGRASIPNGTLPYGTYRVTEASVPLGSGYSANTSYESIVQIESSGIVQADNCPNTGNIFGKIMVQKVDSQLTMALPQGDASLAGAQYTIVNSSENAIMVDGVSYAKGDVVMTITSDERGYAETGMNLPMGTYTVKELAAPNGYTVNDDWTQRVSISENRQVVSLTGEKACKETAMRGRIAVQKLDSVTLTNEVPGSATLEGAQISVINMSANPVVVDEVTYQPGETVCVLTTNESGYAETQTTLPYGTYQLNETKAPKGYSLNSDWHPIVEIREQRLYVMDGDNALLEDAARGHFYFVKADGDTMERLSGIPFLVTSKTTGESHVIVTDMNGVFDSKNTVNSNKTNANDSALIEHDGIVSVDESKLNSSYGVWFSSGSAFAVADEKGSFPYDEYIFEELRVSKNEQYEMVKFEATVSTDGQVVDLGTVDNIRLPYIVTELHDKDTMEHISFASENITLLDKVSFFSLRANKVYEFVGVLVDKETGNAITSGGYPVTATSGEFSTNEANGFKMLQYQFNGTDLAGSALVSVVTVYENGVEIYKDRDLANEAETVYIPKIETDAHSANGSKNVFADTDTVVVDTIAFTNLIPDTTYIIKGQLVDRTTGNAPVSNSGMPVSITAEKVFQPATANGTVDVEFRFDASDMAGKTLVAFETVSRNSIVIAQHTDINSESQTTHIPSIGTTLTSEAGAHQTGANAKTTLVDTVEYRNLVPGYEYTIEGSLFNRATGEQVLRNGKPVTVKKVFTPDTANGYETISFDFDATTLEGSAVVAIESLYDKYGLAACHDDKTDDLQTVWFSMIRTNAYGNDEDKEVFASKAAVITDIVSFWSLIPGASYVLDGIVMDKSTGEPALDDHGNEIRTSVQFSPSEKDGSTMVTFTADMENLAGHTLVVFETLSFNQEIVTAHRQLEDKSQTITLPKIWTTAHSSASSSQELLADGIVTIVDEVRYENVIPGRQYTVYGTMMDKSTGEVMTDKTGNQIYSTTSFVAEASHGKTDVTFTFDASNMKNKTLVAFENLSNNISLVSVHADLNDQSQTIRFPEIKTVLLSNTGKHVVPSADSVTITDTITFQNLIAGNEYIVKGILIDKETGFAVQDSKGNTITAEASFTADSEDGIATLPFTFNSFEFAGKTVVAFEELYNEYGIIATHKQLDSQEQTAYIPAIRTVFAGEHNQKEFFAGNTQVIKDTVYFTGLMPAFHDEYSLVATLMDKESNTPVCDLAGNPITATSHFSTSESSGYATVTFSIEDCEALAGRSVVAFEKLYHENELICAHEDTEDQDQTVMFPEIGTSALAANGSHETLAEKQVVITDTVSYQNLTPGNAYTLKGILYEKPTGESGEIESAVGQPATDDDGNPITATVSFQPTEASGTETVTFTFDGASAQGKTYVVFEELYNTAELIAQHNDIHDAAQAVRFPQIRTTLLAENGLHVSPASTELILTDTVVYSNLEVGVAYTVTGELMTMTNDGVMPVVDENGNPVTSTAQFTAEAPNGTQEIEFHFDGSQYAGQKVVAFETLENNEFGVVAEHKDILDEDQAEYFPAIKTTASGANGEKTLLASEEIVIKDIVEYTGFQPGIEYRFVGTLVNKATGEKLTDAEGNVITAESTLSIPADGSSSGEAIVEFTIDASELAGETLIVFESVYTDDVLLTQHEDVEDEAQTVRFPWIGTTLTSANGEHITHTPTLDEYGMANNLELTDIVEYRNLTPGKAYTLKGKLYVKKTVVLTDENGLDHEEIQAVPYESISNSLASSTVHFTPDSTDGFLKVTFTIYGTQTTPELLKELTHVVAFEELYEGEDQLVAEHADIESEAQSVWFPSIRTNALASNGTHNADISLDDEYVTIIDTVTYTSLIPGKTYKLTGTLMNLVDHGIIRDESGDPVTSEIEFVPEDRDGSIEVNFTIPVELALGKSIVVFENLSLNGELLTEHHDYEDRDQTVEFMTFVYGFKYDASTHDGLAGAEFLIEDKGLSNSDAEVLLVEVQSVVSDEDGVFVFKAIPGHQYSIIETKAPEGYVFQADVSEYIVNIDEYGVASGDLDIPNIHKTENGGTIIITKSDAVTGTPLAGCVISVYKVNSGKKELLFSQTTDSKGRIYFYTEDKGTFVYKETETCDGYYLNEEEYSFTIKDDLSVEGDGKITNIPYGTVVVTKVDSEKKPLTGAQLAFYDVYGRYLGQGTSDAKGRVYFVSPGPGEYYYVETKAPVGYATATNAQYHFTIASDYTVSGNLVLVNSRDPAYSKTGDAQNPMLWAGIAAFSLIAIGYYTAFVLTRKGKKAKKDSAK